MDLYISIYLTLYIGVTITNSMWSGKIILENILINNSHNACEMVSEKSVKNLGKIP